MSQNGEDYCQLNQLGLLPGIKLFFQSVEITKNKGFGRFNLAGYWQKKYRDKVSDEGWFILTNLESLSEALEVYQARMGIEALFKDCKTGGYNERRFSSFSSKTQFVNFINCYCLYLRRFSFEQELNK